jgi:hypothetical protein
MQFQVHLVGKGKSIHASCAPPCVLEGIEPFPPALGARPVACGKGNSFIEEEQLCIALLGHHGPVPAPEFQNARDPAPAFAAAYDFPVGIVQCAASIAHHRAPSVCPEQAAEGINAVLQWH